MADSNITSTLESAEAAIWRGKNEIPQAAGWYRVLRDGDRKVRAFGQGHWWIPLPDGWLSADGVYEWEHLPICAIEGKEFEMSPTDEWKRANDLAGGWDNSSEGKKS